MIVQEFRHRRPAYLCSSLTNGVFARTWRTSCLQPLLPKYSRRPLLFGIRALHQRFDAMS
jgi:hypothetical protein